MEKGKMTDETMAGIALIAVMIASLAGILVFGISGENLLPIAAFSASVSITMVLFGPRPPDGK